MYINTTIPSIALAFLLMGGASGQDGGEGVGKKEVVQGEVDPFAPGDRQVVRSGAPKMVQVQVEFIELSLEALSDLMFMRDPKADATDLRKEVQELVKKDEAKIFETMIVVARPGQKATRESHLEYIYPTEYEPAELPSEVTIEKGAEHGAPITPPTPTAFNMERVGSELEVEPNLGADGQIIELRINPTIKSSMGTRKWMTLKDEIGNENHIQMPDFYTLRMSTGITTQDGDYALLGVLTPPGESDGPDYSRKLIVFAKADVIEIEEGEP